MRIFKNKFFIIALCTALAITVCATVLSIVGVTSPLRSIFGTIFAPIRWSASQISQGFAGFTAYFTEFDRISEENAELRAQLAELERQLAAAEAAKAENDSLREYFGLESLIADWELLDATVIAQAPKLARVKARARPTPRKERDKGDSMKESLTVLITGAAFIMLLYFGHEIKSCALL